MLALLLAVGVAAAGAAALECFECASAADARCALQPFPEPAELVRSCAPGLTHCSVRSQAVDGGAAETNRSCARGPDLEAAGGGCVRARLDLFVAACDRDRCNGRALRPQ